MTPSDTTPQGAEPREDGWISFEVGSPCPVLLQDRVEVRLRNGQGRLDQAGALRWSAREDTDGYDIIAYRVVSPAPAAPTNGGGEPIALSDLTDMFGRPFTDPDDPRLQCARVLTRAEANAVLDHRGGLLAALQPQPTQQGGTEAVRRALEDADALERCAEDADENQWQDWGATMRQAAQRIRILAALNTSEARG